MDLESLYIAYKASRKHNRRSEDMVALEVAHCKDRGKRNYLDSINSYLGMIKATSDQKWAKAVLDAVQRPSFAKDYDNYKITIL